VVEVWLARDRRRPTDHPPPTMTRRFPSSAVASLSLSFRSGRCVELQRPAVAGAADVGAKAHRDGRGVDDASWRLILLAAAVVRVAPRLERRGDAQQSRQRSRAEHRPADVSLAGLASVRQAVPAGCSDFARPRRCMNELGGGLNARVGPSSSTANRARAFRNRGWERRRLDENVG
jgi:hypothetical protein